MTRQQQQQQRQAPRYTQPSLQSVREGLEEGKPWVQSSPSTNQMCPSCAASEDDEFAPAAQQNQYS
ncbi:Hypothetical predicted protein [Scomber scombrus]|uniref:Uncharacterized protein n=1 Tax=Scomber scombrus TaxID=13677 RepID=A0AAV1MXV0_SCOSC